MAFPGEEFFVEDLPNYEAERQSLIIKMVLAFAFWTLIVPLFSAKEEVPHVESHSDNDGTISKKEVTPLPPTSTSKRGKKSKKGAESKTNSSNSGHTSSSDKNAETPAPDDLPKTIRVINAWTNTYCILGLMVHLVFLMLKSSPDNYYTTRSVFETPLLTDDECQYVIEMAERVARRNYEYALNVTQNESVEGTTTADMTKIQDLLIEPRGWQKKRHDNHPTTDLNLVTDPFSKEDRTWIEQKLDARLAPTLERIFGVPPSSVRANDIFIIRYDGDRQASLEVHTDNGSITFSALLSDGFKGGGTRYYNRFPTKNTQDGSDVDGVGEPFAYVLPRKGMMQTFPGLIQHEGVQTEEGRRYLLIGFLAVDRVDPWTGQSTGLPWLASWGSLNWATTKMKDGWKELLEQLEMDLLVGKKNWSASNRLRQLFMTLQHGLIVLGEVMYQHRFATLVNETNATDYLKALDKSYGARSSAPSLSSPLPSSSGASWFSGQQVQVHFDGSFQKNWNTRNANQEHFAKLEQSNK